MRIGLVILLLLVFKVSFGQNNYSLQVVSGDKPAEFFKKHFSYSSHQKDSLHANQEAKDLLNKLRSYGYAGASIDSIKADTLRAVIYIYVGEKLENIVLRNGNVDERLLGDAGVKNAVLSGKPIKVSEAQSVKQKLIVRCENTGYPFASARLDSFSQTNGIFTARVFLDRHDEIRYDTLHILGKTKVKKAFLRNYLGIKPGKIYNEATVKKITQRINSLQFLETIQPHTVEFLNGKAKPNLYLKDKKASQFDFLVGFLPGSAGQKLLVTGEATLHLLSPFGMGEEFYLKWQKLQPKTQTLDIKVNYPYIIGIPLGINANFD
ncbi:MAG: hypothetical protein JWO06_772, partial [Bacteroidota bacterium]|nr:hypothetical protein [Bacteroidota bacterium]